MSKLVEFLECPCCGQNRYVLQQDKVHLDWSRTCLACGYEREMMPRAKSRVNAYDISVSEDEYDALRSGLLVGELEDLFPSLTDD